MLHITFQTSSRSKYSNRLLELLLRALGNQILWYYFVVFGPGVQILLVQIRNWTPWAGVQLFQRGA